MFYKIFCLIILISSIESLKNIEIQTSTSIIVGKQFNIKIGSKISEINQFTGITYGRAKRFQRSKPEWKLDSTRIKIDATKPSKFCPQQSGFIEMFRNELPEEERQLTGIDENCLQLNVWVSNENQSSFELKPVIVWFHGGSFISDTTARLLYNGKYLAAQEKIVVVTVNHRLDAFGFLYTGQNGTMKTQSNAGIWDQLLALEWVQEHIEYFQGDPKRITIAGFDSGATSVGLHLIAPRSRRLFNQILMMSGSIFTQLISARSVCNYEVAEMWSRMASTISCGENWSAKTLKCMKHSSIDKILKLIDPLGLISTGPEIIFDPNDDLFPFNTLPEAIEKIQTSKLAVMIGSTDDEGSQVLPMMDGKLFHQILLDKKLSKNEFTKQIIGLTSKLVLPRGCDHNKVDGNEIAKYYSSVLNLEYDYRTIGQLIGDFYVSCPSTFFAEKLINRKTDQPKLYQYVWSQKSRPNRFAPCLEWMGSCHGTDVPMMFGMPYISPDDFNDQDREISKKFMRTIGHFVRKGRPNIKQWLPWTINENNSLNMPYSLFIDGKWKIETNWKYQQCNQVWAKYLMINESNNNNYTCRRESSKTN